MLFKRNKISINNQKRIILVLFFMSLSIGIWFNYRQIWLLDNLIAIEKIGKILSIGFLGSSIISIIVSFFSTKVKIKEILVLTTSISIVSMIGLLFLYKSDNIYLIKLLVLLTIICENLFLVGIYPLLTTVKKSSMMFEKNTIVQNLGKDLGVFIGGIFIGRVLFNYKLDSNFCLLLSIILSLISFYFLITIRYEKDNTNKIKIKKYKDALKEIFSKKIIVIYFLFCFFLNIAWDTVMGLQFILLTDTFSFTENISSNFLLIFGMISTFIAIFVVRKIKFKNNFRACLYKYGTRAILYLIAFILNSKICFILAFTVTLLNSRMASKYTDGRYINVISDDLQLMISNLRFVMICLGETVGLFIAGIVFNYGVKYLFLVAFLFYMVALILSYYLSIMYDNKRF